LGVYLRCQVAHEVVCARSGGGAVGGGGGGAASTTGPAGRPSDFLRRRLNPRCGTGRHPPGRASGGGAGGSSSGGKSAGGCGPRGPVLGFLGKFNRLSQRKLCNETMNSPIWIKHTTRFVLAS